MKAISSVFAIGNKLDGVDPFITDSQLANFSFQHPPNFQTATDTDTPLFSDICDTMSTSSIWLYRQIKENTHTHS